MLKKRVRLLVLAILSVTLVTGCRYSSGNNSSEGSTANTSNTAFEVTQSNSQEEQKENIKRSYENLETKYREFAGDIAQIQGESIDYTKLQADRTCTTENSCFTLYQVLKNLQGESLQTGTGAIDIKKAYLGASYQNFDDLDKEINRFKNNDADVKGLISSEDLPSLEISEELKTIMGYFQDNILSVDEIKKIQNKDNPASSDGIFGPGTYNELKTILVTETQELGNQLKDIKNNLEPEPEPPITQLQSKIDKLEKQLLWLYLAAGLGLLFGIFSARTSLLNARKLQRKPQISLTTFSEDIENLKSNIDNNHQNINSFKDEIHKLQQTVKQSPQTNNSAIVTGSLVNQQPKPLNISIEELICLYNYTPQILLEYIIPVSVTVETYRQQTKDKIYLELVNNGYYWVVLTENSQDKSYWLLPNAMRKINLHRQRQAIESLFILEGETPESNSEFSLEKPAKIDILPNGKLWQLQEKGSLCVGKLSIAGKLLTELLVIAKAEGKENKNLEELFKFVQEAKELIATNHQNNQSIKQSLQAQSQEIKVSETINVNLPKIKVRMTPDTINQALCDTLTNSVELEEHPQGEYLVVSNDKNNQYLILNPETVFTRPNLIIMNISRLFICRGDLATTRKGKDIQVIKPAKVEKTNEGWRLVESGEIQL